MDDAKQVSGQSRGSSSNEEDASGLKCAGSQKSSKSNLRIKLPQNIRLWNLESNAEYNDHLHSDTGIISTNTKCSEKVCLGSTYNIPGRGGVPRTPDEVYVEAEAFLKQYFASIKRENSEAHLSRLREVKHELSKTSTYQLKTSELVFGAKLAWRNAARCIGRIQWKKLQVFDCREVTTATGMFEALCNHIKYATNKGNIRSAMTIFPQRTDDGKHDYRIWNPQVIGYAGYRQPDGTALGDAARIEFTEGDCRLTPDRRGESQWDGIIIQSDEIPIYPARDRLNYHVLTVKENIERKPAYPFRDRNLITLCDEATPLDFTLVCKKLGWKPRYTEWDILPLVLSANGKPPEYFEIPRDIVMEVELEHPEYDWFKELGLKWYALPAVSNMSFDCGGLEFTATAFNGWYMNTEVGCRDLCDVNRYNITEKVALKMGLDTQTYATLWKDRALVEVNVAVLHSFQRENVTILDHHTASDQFIKHFETESRTRGGCPADWVWIVPPMSGSLTPVFHQEMALYYLKPSYDYQESPWKTYQWDSPDGEKLPKRKFHFKQIARAVKFTSKLFGRALSKRIKATILYATETGKSEQYAKELGNIFGHAFNAQVHCMENYDMFSIEHETLLLVVASTFGNGEPPGNGVTFAEHLFKMLYENRNQDDHTKDLSAGSFKLPSPKTLLRTNSFMPSTKEYKTQLSRLESLRSSLSAPSSIEADTTGPLSNVCFAVFSLGSSAYPKFCNFGKTVDKILGKLGGQRLLEVGTGDELYGQEQQFRQWASTIFHTACETFCIEDNEMVKDAQSNFEKMPLTEATVRFGKVPPQNVEPLKSALEKSFRKHLVTCTVRENSDLGYGYDENSALTIFLDMKPHDEVKYEPGDHIGVMACNRKEIVDSVLSRLKDVDEYDKPLQLQLMKEHISPTGVTKTWENHEKLPAVTVRELFTRFLDITTPSTKVLKYLADSCSNQEEAKEIRGLVMDSQKYDDWKHHFYPHLGEVLEQFPSCKPTASLLAALLPSLQPRFYSISSSPLAHPNRIHLTVAVVTYKTQNGDGSMHFGVCSTYLQSLKHGDELFVFHRRSISFQMPKDISVPLILVGPGTGIAPFRGFWHHRMYQVKHNINKQNPGEMWLFFGCRTKSLDLYEKEKEQAVAKGVLTKALVAYSREKNIKKQHVQSLLEEHGEAVTRMLLDEDGHFYVCGDCKMAEDVQQKLRGIIKKHAQMTDEDVSNVILTLMDENRYHEDIFGITLRTAEVHKTSRESAKRTRLESAASQN